MKPDRVAALIIEDKKILLVSTNSSERFWTPGGKAESGETPEQAMRRELSEELGLTLEVMQEYLVVEDSDQKTTYYLTDCGGKPRPQNEIETVQWFSREEIQLSGGPFTPNMKKLIAPRLIAEGRL